MAEELYADRRRRAGRIPGAWRARSGHRPAGPARQARQRRRPAPARLGCQRQPPFFVQPQRLARPERPDDAAIHHGRPAKSARPSRPRRRRSGESSTVHTPPFPPHPARPPLAPYSPPVSTQPDPADRPAPLLGHHTRTTPHHTPPPTP